MRDKRSITSLPSIFLLAVLLVIIGASVWRSGGLAFSPGPLSAKSRAEFEAQEFTSHAAFEGDCHRCHQPLKVQQAALCMDCHTGVSRQVALQEGLHGKIEMVDRCYDCHSDHHGREFDLLVDALAQFDHTFTSFSLNWHQVNYDATLMECKACHVRSGEFLFEAGSCYNCHATDSEEFMEQHTQDFGGECLGCHDGKDRMADFDHQSTGFPLEGKHAESGCADCHRIPQFGNLRQECVGCHAEPAVHQGFFGLDCATCHNPDAWKPALISGNPFDHNVLGDFSLILHHKNYSGGTLKCQDCHEEDLSTFDTGRCAACHSSEDSLFMEQHLTQFGENCLECHDGVDRMSDFSHDRFFSLEGRHMEIQCEACHASKTFRGTPDKCAQCHAEPAIHAGFFGLNCDYCHSASAWTPAEIRIHTFPLDHGGAGDIACQTCHTDIYMEYTCFGCHDHQPGPITDAHVRSGVTPEELLDCAKCHPGGLLEAAGG